MNYELKNNVSIISELYNYTILNDLIISLCKETYLATGTTVVTSVILGCLKFCYKDFQAELTLIRRTVRYPCGLQKSKYWNLLRKTFHVCNHILMILDYWLFKCNMSYENITKKTFMYCIVIVDASGKIR